MSQHKTIIRAFGGDRTTAALFEALGFWDGKGGDPDWVYKTIEEWRAELLCTCYRFNASARKLLDLGLIERERRLCPKGTTPYHYRLKMEAAVEWLLQALGSDPENGDSAPTNRRKRNMHVAKTQGPIGENVTSCSTVLDHSSVLQFWGGSDSQLCTRTIETAPPHSHTQHPPTLPPIQGAAGPEAADEPDPFFLALVACCLIDTSAMREGDGYSRQLGAAVASLRQKGVKPDEVRAFGQWWRTEHMRNGSPPELCQVVPNWLRFTAWRKAHQPALRRDAMVVEVAALSRADREDWRAASQAERERVKASMRRPNGRANGHDSQPAKAARHGPGSGRARAPTAAGVARAAPALEAGERASPVPGGPGGGGPGARAAEGGMESARVGGDG